MMNERAQFLWGAGTIGLWLVTFLYVVGYYSAASTLKMSFLSREVPRGTGMTHWNARFGPAMDVPEGLRAVNCTNSTSAPICACLVASVDAARTRCLAVGRQRMQKCFMLARHVQFVTVHSEWIRPYIQLLMVNMWAALTGSIFLVRGKLAEKNSYAVQLLFQVVILLLTIGAMWISFGATPGEWITLLLVSVALIGLGWMTDGDDDSWVAYQFHLLYTATLPGLWVLYCAYNHRLDTLFFSTTVALTVVLALLAAGRMCFERVADAGYGVVTWCNMVAALLTGVLLAFTYDEHQSNLLGSASYAWIAFAVYATLSVHRMAGVQQTLFIELLMRFVLVVAMTKELFV